MYCYYKTLKDLKNGFKVYLAQVSNMYDNDLILFNTKYTKDLKCYWSSLSELDQEVR